MAKSLLCALFLILLIGSTCGQLHRKRLSGTLSFNGGRLQGRSRAVSPLVQLESMQGGQDATKLTMTYERRVWTSDSRLEKLIFFSSEVSMRSCRMVLKLLSEGKEQEAPTFRESQNSFRAVLDSLDEGVYEYMIEAEGEVNGRTFSRHIRDHFSVRASAPTISLTGTVVVENDSTDDDYLVFHIPIAGTIIDDVYVYAEVPGVAWMASVVPAELSYLPLHLHKQWVAEANTIDPSLRLQSVIVMDRHTHETLAQIPQMDLNDLNLINAVRVERPPLRANMPSALFLVMQEGKPPEYVAPAVNDMFPSVKLNETVVILSHGYCSDGFIWTTDNFTNVVKFVDREQGISNDEFARRLSVYGTNFSSCSIVAHSQGGLASLTMLQFYFSCLDRNNGRGKLIQTVGTPYHGSSLALRWSDIFGRLGLGCGYVADLSHAGSQLWISRITPQKVSKVHYYTTTSGPTEPCDHRTEIFLEKPNDGVTELSYDLLEPTLAVYEGNSEGECHTEGMNFPPQTTNVTRNMKMNADAARATYETITPTPTPVPSPTSKSKSIGLIVAAIFLAIGVLIIAFGLYRCFVKVTCHGHGHGRSEERRPLMGDRGSSSMHDSTREVIAIT